MFGRLTRHLLNNMKSSQTIESTGLTISPNLSLLTFQGGESSLSRWRLDCDREHGGFSEPRLSTPSDETMLFSGHTSLELDHTRTVTSPFEKRRSTRTGWCCMHTEIPVGQWNLRDYDGLKFSLRSDMRHYAINLTTRGIMDGIQASLFQAVLQPPPKPGVWGEVRIPFGAFMETDRGMVIAHRAMNLETPTRFGILIADGTDAPFEMELREISAFRFTEDEMEIPAVREAVDLNRSLGYGM
mmetsp:Transcript_16556/g.35511  ORF Transcript_16556/g.35511 Transcript_16556/m.35511 type:complete len:242 (+) Transcript_16556:245-970(+)|eukprot:3097257-Pleurochrysis_carterae.AAC.6